jgi:hypothetical protein
MERQSTSKLPSNRLTVTQARRRIRQSTANSFSSESIRDESAVVRRRNVVGNAIGYAEHYSCSHDADPCLRWHWKCDRNARTQGRFQRMNAADLDRLSDAEKEHFGQCRKCRQFVDKRELRDVLSHETDHKPKPHIPRIKGKRIS